MGENISGSEQNKKKNRLFLCRPINNDCATMSRTVLMIASECKQNGYCMGNNHIKYTKLPDSYSTRSNSWGKHLHTSFWMQLFLLFYLALDGR